MDFKAAVGRARAKRTLPDAAMRRVIRERAGLSQAEIAAIVGVDLRTIRRWENGEREPSGELLDNYACLLDRLKAELLS